MFHCLPDSAWADGNLAEVAGQDGGTRKSKSTQPRSRLTWDTLYNKYKLNSRIPSPSGNNGEGDNDDDAAWGSDRRVRQGRLLRHLPDAAGARSHDGRRLPPQGKGAPIYDVHELFGFIGPLPLSTK